MDIPGAFTVTLIIIASCYILPKVMKVIIWVWKIKRIQAVVDNFLVGPKPHWLYGHLNILTGPNEHFLHLCTEWTKKAEDGAFALNLGLSSQFTTCHPDTVKLILKTAEPKGFIPASGLSYNLLVPWLGDGLLTSSGDKWFRNRRLLTPAFHFDILKPYMKIYNECATKLICSIRSGSEDGQSIEVFNLVSLCTLNIMRKCAFSASDDVQSEGSSSQYIQAVTEMSALIMERTQQPLFLLDNIYSKFKKGKRFFELCDLSHTVADEVIKKRKEDLQTIKPDKDNRKYVDFLDILLLARDSDGNGLTSVEIRDEVETFMFEGHDTTASAISWILYNLARHPRYQQKAYEEVKSLLDTKPKPEFEWSDTDNIPYLTRCIKESMRIHPPVPIIDRELSKPLEVKGHKLLPGTIVNIMAYAVHHNPRVWGDDHMIFNPDRFLLDNISNMDSFAYIPFSAGPRNCIGQHFAMNEIKTTIALILYHYEFSVDTSHKIEMAPLLVLRAKYGIKLCFKTRDNLC